MSRCWPEGELRAWLDRELPEADGAALERHVAECAACTATLQMLRARAERVGLLMDSLAEAVEPRPVAVMPAVMARRPRRAWLWSGLAAGLAAGVTLAFILAPWHRARPVLPAPQRALVSTPVTDRGPGVVAPKPASQIARIPSPRRPAAKPVPRDDGEYYLALDDEPIETGVVMRVALEGNLQADVIFDSQGRARAIRPVR